VKILGLDTSTLTSGIAVVDDGKMLAEARHDASAHKSDLLVAIDDVCKRAGVTPMQLDAIAVGAGPGSFTGLRIGMATAKGIAFAAGKPLWAVSSLAALAWGHQGFVVAVLDARKREAYAGCYRDGVLLDVERVLPPADVGPWSAQLAGGQPITFVGDMLAPEITTPSGAAVAWLALAGARVDVVTEAAPSYIRKAEAEVMYPDGVPGALPRRDP
jgi:tRNA threonylcarbamoyladenosine biosynthesis protein TsaB